MKFFVIDIKKEAEICIYGIDNSEKTEEFMEKHFLGNGLQFLSSEEQKEYNTDCKYAITYSNFNYIAQRIDKIQEAIDRVSKDVKKSKCNPEELYTFDDNCYVI